MITSENQIVCFPSCVLTVFWCSTSYTVIFCVLNDVNGACWCICSLVALRTPHMCFWPAIEKNLNFLRCIHVFDLVLKHGLDINEGNWLQLLFYFIVWMGIVTAVIENRFFFSCVSCFRLNVSRIALWLKRLQLIPKVIWPRMDWFCGFLLENGFPRWFHICMG